MFGKKKSRLVVIGKYKISLNGRNIPFIMKRSSRACYMRLEIKPGQGLVVIVPRRCGNDQVTWFLESKQGWILNRLDKYHLGQKPDIKKELIDGDCIPYLGRELKLVVRRDVAEADLIYLEKDRLVLNLNHHGIGISPMVEKWYRAQAVNILSQKIEKIGLQMGIKPLGFVVRGQRTRWGSCSRRGRLSLNWKLLRTPEPVIDYVIAHELAHVKQMNHSSRFWDIVAKYYPEYKKSRKWLRQHDDLLAD